MNKTIRKRKLPEGWYPYSGKSVSKSIKEWEDGTAVENSKSVIVPHAGWYFSGRIACNTIRRICKKTDIIVVAGGHLSEFDPVMIAEEDYFETPVGNIKNSVKLCENLLSLKITRPDRVPDNTVEIQLPFIKYYFPDAEIIWIRIPPDYKKVLSIVEVLISFEKETGKKISVAGSTDLTHYGLNYGFTSHGKAEEALYWVKNINDKTYINYLLDFKAEQSLKHAVNERSACSSGGAALALLFAQKSGCINSDLLYYYTSNDIYPSDSFVGYAGIVYS